MVDSSLDDGLILLATTTVARAEGNHKGGEGFASTPSDRFAVATGLFLLYALMNGGEPVEVGYRSYEAHFYGFNRCHESICRQYCGTFGSMRSAQALMPPATYLSLP